MGTHNFNRENQNTQNLLIILKFSPSLIVTRPKSEGRGCSDHGPSVFPRNGSLVHSPKSLVPSLDSWFCSQRSLFLSIAHVCN